MTRKDYDLIAKALNEAHKQAIADTNATSEYYVVEAINIMTDKLMSTNPRFDPDRFKTACYN